MLMMASVHQWDHLILPVSVQLATLDLPVKLTSMTVYLQPAPATVCVWMESMPLNADVWESQWYLCNGITDRKSQCRSVLNNITIMREIFIHN